MRLKLGFERILVERLGGGVAGLCCWLPGRRFGSSWQPGRRFGSSWQPGRRVGSSWQPGRRFGSVVL